MTSRDIVRIARQRAGLTQQQLADRSGHPRETIARWETGAREPSLSTLRSVVEAANLDVVITLAERDASLAAAVRDQLDVAPMKRLQRLLPAYEWKDTRRALRWLSRAHTPAILIGPVAALLQGAPQRPHTGIVEFVSGDPFAMERELRAGGLVAVDSVWTLPKGGRLALARNVPGTGDYRDLRRSAQRVQLDRNTVLLAAHPRDLLRTADASSSEVERARTPGLRALLEAAAAR